MNLLSNILICISIMIAMKMITLRILAMEISATEMSPSAVQTDHPFAIMKFSLFHEEDEISAGGNYHEDDSDQGDSDDC